MTPVIVLGLCVLGLILLLFRQARLAETERARILSASVQERASLLDRIQHPEVRQVEQAEVEPWEPPKDLAELAHLGQIVPDGVTVGSASSGEE
jgi:hypothetical protein